MKRVAKDQTGSLGLGVGLALLALVLVVGAWWALRSGDTSEAAPTDPKVAFEELKARVQQVMSQPPVVTASVERNANAFACLFESTGRCQGKGGLFLLYESTRPGSSALSQLIRGNGLSAEGHGCTGFPSAACPLRVEAEWKPVCGGNYCENTRSFRLQASVTLQSDAKATPERWQMENMFTPTIKLSAAVTCERGGGTWAATRCMGHGEVAEREMATRIAETGGVVPAEPSVMDAQELLCPDHIQIQGQLYTLERMNMNDGRMPANSGGERGQVRVAAMNGCPAYDTFTFQCQAKTPAQYAGEGQWIQVEAQMAPNCETQDQVINENGEQGEYSRQ